jgi:hypothetical protein
VFRCRLEVHVTGTPDIRHLKALRLPAVVPSFALSAFLGFPTFTVNRYPPFSTTGSTYASLPALVESIQVEASGTSTSANAGLGLFTVLAQSQAITLSCLPL